MNYTNAIRYSQYFFINLSHTSLVLYHNPLVNDIIFSKGGYYNMLSFNNRLKQIRKSKGLTQDALGLLINKSAQVISNWERGYTTTINQDDIQRLAKAFGMKISELIDDQEYTSYDKSESNQPKDLSTLLSQPEIIFDGEIYKLNDELRQGIHDAIEFVLYKSKKGNKK